MIGLGSDKKKRPSPPVGTKSQLFPKHFSALLLQDNLQKKSFVRYNGCSSHFDFIFFVALCVINICFCFYLSKNICNCLYLYLSMKIEHSRQRLLLECSSRITRRRFLVGVSSSSTSPSFSSSSSSSDFFVGLSDFFLDLSSQKKREAASSSVGGLSNTFPPTPTPSSIILPSYSDDQTPKPPHHHHDPI